MKHYLVFSKIFLTPPNSEAGFSSTMSAFQMENYLSEVGFEPTPPNGDCDLNAAP